MKFTSKFTIALLLVTLSFVFYAGAQAQNRNPEALQKWVKEGSLQKINGHDIFVCHLTLLSVNCLNSD